MASFQELLATKYALERQKTQSESDLQAAQAGLIKSQTATNPQEAAAREAQGFGAGAQGQGFGAYYGSLAQAEPQLAQSEEALRGGQTNEANATAGAANRLTNFATAPATGLRLGILGQRAGQAFPGNATGTPDAGGFGQGNGFNSGKPEGDAMGNSDVGGAAKPKPGPTDTQPAMLTPGEAVLNVGATQHLGKDVIDVLNAIGRIKMGGGTEQGDPGSGPATKVQASGAGGVKGYSDGTSGVPGYASGSSGVGTAGGGVGSGIDPIAGQGGTWTPPQPSTGASIRGSLGLGVPRPGYSDGTSQVMDFVHHDAARNAKAGDGAGKGPKGKPENGVKENQHPAATVARGSGGHGEEPGYAKGTSKVAGKGAKGPAKGGASKVTPEMLQQLMALGKGQGGMPQPGPGGPQPMPMPMPQTAGPPQGPGV